MLAAWAGLNEVSWKEAVAAAVWHLAGHARAARDADTDDEARGLHRDWIALKYAKAMDGEKPGFILADIEPPGPDAWDSPPVTR